MTGSRGTADLLLERAEICHTLFGMAADSPERVAAANRLREIHSDPAVARILEKATSATPSAEVAEWVTPKPPDEGAPEMVAWPPDAA
jgi:hypothetical protein